MATITGLTAERMQEIIDKTIVDVDIIAQHLILTLEDGSTIDAGAVGPAGKGTAFPAGATDGDLFVRTDMAGDPLYKYTDGAWTIFTGGGVSKGSSFPVAPAPTDGDLFVRTDLPGDPMYKLTDGVWEQQPRMGAQNVPGARSTYTGTAPSIASSTAVAIPFNQEEYDTDTLHDSAVNNTRFTVKTPGVYLLRAGVTFSPNANGRRETYFQKNGSSFYAEDIRGAPPAGSLSATNAAVLRLAAGDYIEFMAWHDSGSTLTLTTPEFEAIWLGGAGQIVDERGVPAASVVRVDASFGATQSVPHGTYTAVSFNTVEFDTDGLFALTSPTRLTAKTPGLYTIRGSASFDGNATGLRLVAIFKNGVSLHREAGSAAGNTDFTEREVEVSTILAAGDYLEVMVLQLSGSPLVLRGDAAAARPRFQAVLNGSSKTVTPFAVAKSTAAVLAPNNTPTAIPLAAEDADNDNMHDTVTTNTRITCRTAGVYLFLGTVIFDNPSGGRRGAWLNKNGSLADESTLGAPAATLSAGPRYQVVGLMELAVGDYVELLAFQDSGVGMNIYNPSSLKAVKIGSPNAGNTGLPPAPTVGRGCQAWATAAQSIPNVTFTAFTFATEQWDDLNMHDPTVNNSRITIPAGYGGKWQFDAHTDWSNPSTGKKAIGFRVNGSGGYYRGWNSTPGGGWAGGNPGDILGTSTVLNLAAGDYVELICLCSGQTTDVANLEGVSMTCAFLGNG